MNSGAASMTRTSWPSVCKASPAVRPPKPAPTTRTFNDLDACGILIFRRKGIFLVCSCFPVCSSKSSNVSIR